MNGQSESNYWRVMKPINLSEEEVSYAHSLRKYQEYKNAIILKFGSPKSYEEWKREQQ